MSTRRFLFASRTSLVISILALSAVATVHAAKFDENIKVPRSASAADFKTHARAYFKTYETRKAVDEPGVLIRDAAAYAKWIETEWRLTTASDEKIALGNLTEFGLQRSKDGSYSVKVRDYPQWMPLDLALMTLRERSVFDSYARELKARGFRDQDLAFLKNYLESNSWERAAFAENKELTESFAARAQALQRAKSTISPEETMSFVYQRTRNAAEARRAWAVGLLDSLDKQRQRILISYFGELETTRTYGPPAQNLKAQLDRTIAPLLSGEYVEILKQEEMRVRQ